MKSPFFSSALLHRNFVSARDTVTTLLQNSPGGKVVALLGPTQTGKSKIFRHVVGELGKCLVSGNPAAMPVVSLTIAASQDGRISPKHLTLKLLKAVRHPIYMHIGDLDELQHYRPSRGSDEGTLRSALESALEARETMYLNLDEAHHLTHTRDPNVRSNVLQSIKCFSAIERTLFLCGGYELAYRGLFDSAHFAGRLVCVEFSPYTDCRRDFEEWLRILKAFSANLNLSPNTLLIDHAVELLAACNGSFGLLEKILWSCRAKNSERAIDGRALLASFPLKREHEVIHRDINRGREALASLPTIDLTHSDVACSEAKPRRRRPFKRNPNRHSGQQMPEVDDE